MDFDNSNEVGGALLIMQVCHTIMLHLYEHLWLLVSLAEDRPVKWRAA